MKFEKLKQLAQSMDVGEMEGALRSLAADQRFAAVVALALFHKEQFVDAGSQQRLAGHHGALAHTAGSVHALNELLNAIRKVCDPPKRRGVQAPPDKDQ